MIIHVVDYFSDVLLKPKSVLFIVRLMQGRVFGFPRAGDEVRYTIGNDHESECKYPVLHYSKSTFYQMISNTLADQHTERDNNYPRLHSIYP